MMQLIWNGLIVGSFYALVALGYSMVYGIIKLLNFAHGDIYMLGAFVGFFTLSAFGISNETSIPLLLVVLLLSMVTTGLIGVGIERIAYRPLRRSPRLAVLITAIGVSFTLEYGVRQIFGPNPEAFPIRLESSGFDVLGMRVTASQIVLVVIAAVLMLVLAHIVERTRQGRAMRAIALDPTGAQLMGVNVDRVIAMVFFIGSALAGAAGVMAGAYYGSIDFLMGFIIGLKAFTAAVIGGIGNLYGAMLGGVLLGMLESFGSAWFGGEWRDVFAFGFLILFLTLKPTGLLGARVVERM
ncbi:MAG TPA: branched-chain amino acid ABC transporter permease [Agromyces sp.]|jgi:branched-chain amino acid transport system permease protein|uniref:Branched-chain amino acid transport system permease protein n=3 Tax=Agromyces TaxID=33877 RepID=A0A852X2P3_9MICO|nr:MULTISPECIES: branched-chain amino acid ABC transporter permease [Agromyces]KQZ08597.1 ABC transporter permease [Agromyces sp. Root1464]KRC63047.1 ABC transporter permease [Agromyces sp. Root81]MBM7830215.1 branched-chain amino acid transport system permease protein [Agromyces cerinus]NYG20345.1 branched-chain amino acid transport system permease protein [Agromyces hippuratus]RXZ50871.1 branched-chain amino acid ABC transporter permease [Agromyces fucosus]